MLGLQADGCGRHADGSIREALVPFRCLLCGQHWMDCSCTTCFEDGGPCACLTTVVKITHWQRKVCPDHSAGVVCKINGQDALYCQGVRPRAITCIGFDCHKFACALWHASVKHHYDDALFMRQCNKFQPLADFSRKATGDWQR